MSPFPGTRETQAQANSYDEAFEVCNFTADLKRASACANSLTVCEELGATSDKLDCQPEPHWLRRLAGRLRPLNGGAKLSFGALPSDAAKDVSGAQLEAAEAAAIPMEPNSIV